MNKAGVLEKVLCAAQEIILAVDSGNATLDDLLDHSDPGCRRTLEHLLLNIFRFRKSINVLWRQYCSRHPAKEVAALLDCALGQALLQSAVATQSVVNVAVTAARKYHADKFVNAILRKALQKPWTPPSTAAEILPDAILNRWQKEFSGEKVAEFAGLFTGEAEFSFRLCRDAALPDNCREVPGCGSFRFAVGKAREILTGPEFAAGKYYVQDPAASLAISLVEKDLPRCRSVIDLCAAPGGKTLMLAEKISPGTLLTAADRSARRQKLTAENFRKHHVSGRIITAEPAEISGRFDLVLADVPCSNSGVFRRRPDALWRFSENELCRVMALQQQIIARAAALVAPGGVLLCSTCSIENDENDALVAAAIAAVPGMVCTAKSTLLPNKNRDGAFAARIELPADK